MPDRQSVQPLFAIRRHVNRSHNPGHADCDPQAALSALELVRASRTLRDEPKEVPIRSLSVCFSVTRVVAQSVCISRLKGQRLMVARVERRRMGCMGDAQELIEKPLTTEELVTRYRAMSEDPCFANVPGKIELDAWGRILMSPPPAVYHGRVQGNLAHKLKAVLGGHIITEGPIATPDGLFLPDVAWASPDFMSAHPESPLARAPEICVEVVSPSNSVQEMSEKTQAYLAAGAEEVWIVYPQSKRIEFLGRQGRMPRSSYAVDLSDVFV